MHVVASGTVFDTCHAPANERSASSSAALALADGTLLASFRLGTERESDDGHAAVLASRDLGVTASVWSPSTPTAGTRQGCASR